MILLSHPTGNQNVRQAALAFAEAGLLAEFWTGINWKQDSLLDHLLFIAPRVRNELRRRSFPTELTRFIHTVPGREWLRLLAGQLGWKGLFRDENSPLSVDSVYRSVDRRVAQRVGSGLTSKAVYAYDDGALETFHAAKIRGLKCVYEHPIISWRVVRELQREEAELQPEWAPTLVALKDSNEKLARKDEELALADVIVTASSFARDCVMSAPGRKARVVVIPYGTEPSNSPMPGLSSSKRLRVLFVGSLTQAKGLGYLLEAVAQLGEEIDFTMIGRQVSRIIPASSVLARYRWIPSLSHHELLQEMSRHDVLVLPSLHEGFGLVMTEAMAQGLVVVTTSHTAGPDLITDGVEGFVVPIRSAAAIEEKLALLQRDRDRLGAMQIAAREKTSAFTWEDYRQRMTTLAREVVDKQVD